MFCKILTSLEYTISINTTCSNLICHALSAKAYTLGISIGECYVIVRLVVDVVDAFPLEIPNRDFECNVNNEHVEL